MLAFAHECKPVLHGAGLTNRSSWLTQRFLAHLGHALIASPHG